MRHNVKKDKRAKATTTPRRSNNKKPEIQPGKEAPSARWADYLGAEDDVMKELARIKIEEPEPVIEATNRQSPVTVITDLVDKFGINGSKRNITRPDSPLRKMCTNASPTIG